ncbi:MAG: NADH-quinone oxidoreductase subunit J [Thermodesulfovibrio sp.]|nr:NADH-quinone oxidoreductase subunit J [Thermodesulfovibrio sp.]MDW7972034.1 NADH-quinone oxidoreductase subunit J [Thermodesulfovibrio sp.]
MNQIIEQIFYIYFFISLSILSIGVIASKNIIHSAFFLLIFLLHVAAVFLFLNAEFLMIIQIIVYVGGVLALFIFAIMVMNIKEELRHKRFVKFSIAGLITGLLFLGILYVFLADVRASENVLTTSDVTLLGKLLYSYYLLPFEILSLVLLIALVGGIIIAKKTPFDKEAK